MFSEFLRLSHEMNVCNVTFSCKLQKKGGRMYYKVNSAFRSGVGKSVTVTACMAGVRQGAFTCVGWKVTLCYPIWQVTSRRSEMWFPGRATCISAFTLFYLFSCPHATAAWFSRLWLWIPGLMILITKLECWTLFSILWRQITDRPLLFRPFCINLVQWLAVLC